MDGSGEPGGPRPPMQLDALGDLQDVGGVELTEKDRKIFQRLNADPEDLFDRTMIAKQAMEKRGKQMGSVLRYMMKIARNDFSQSNGVPIGVVEEIATGNRFQREAARRDLANAWARQLAGKRHGAERRETSNGSALLAALKR